MAVILIAEDSPDIRTIPAPVFTRTGYTMLTEPDGAAAWHRAQAEHPDVVLTDLDMPYLNGLQLCHIRRHPTLHTVPVAIPSGALLPGDPAYPARTCAKSCTSPSRTTTCSPPSTD